MDTDYNRPRRPNADTLTYLKSLPFHEIVAHEEIEHYVKQQKEVTKDGVDESKDTVDYPQNFSAAMSALDEIKNEIASLAGDEFGSQCIETITRITTPYSTVAARKLLHGISNYLVHLSTHRYGSHVVQTILQNVLKGKNVLDLSDNELCNILEIDQEDDDELNYLPSMKDILISVTEELMPATKELAVHICGSHVLRSLICILSGVEEEIPRHLLNKGGFMEGGGTRRGKVKGKKKKKKKIDSEGSNGVLNSASFSNYKIVTDPRFNVNEYFVSDCFFSLVWELTGIDFKSKDEQQNNELGDLQQLACNPSAGPLLIVLLRVLTLAYCEQNGKRSDSEVEETKNDDGISEFRLGIIPQQKYFENGSKAEILAKHIICWNHSISDASEQKKSGEVIYGLSGETRGSHMLETLLRTSNDAFYDSICQAGKFLDSDSFIEYAEHDVSNFVIQTFVNTVRTRAQAESVIKCMEKLIGNGYVLDVGNKRRGLFWRVCEMSSKFRIGQESILKQMRRGFTSLRAKKGDSKMDDSQSSLIEVSECIPLLLCYQASENDGGRINLDAAGTRTVYHLLRFVPRLANDILDGVVSKHSAAALVSMCKDGFGSRCVVDGILDGPINQESFEKAKKQLFEKLKNNLIPLSLDRVGHHTVRKIFLKLKSFDDKAFISATLSKSMRALSGNAMGRSIISDCLVREYMEDEAAWRSAIKKAQEKETFLKDIVDGSGASKKRKRKRKKKDNDEDNSMKTIKVDQNEDQ